MDPEREGGFDQGFEQSGFAHAVAAHDGEDLFAAEF